MMRRSIVLTILIVVLATLLNLAIALGFWWFGERPPAPDPTSRVPLVVGLRPLDLVVWRKRRGPDWPDEPHAATRHSYLGITFRGMLWTRTEATGHWDFDPSNITRQDRYSIDNVELGWPLRCIAGELWHEWHGPPGMLVASGAQWPNRVIWSGMIVNEVFYGSVIALSFVGWIQARRAIRRKRGQCTKCGYDLRGDFSAGCPECGWRREGSDELKG